MNTTTTINAASARHLFASCRTPARCSKAAERVSRLCERATGRKAAALAWLADALNEHRHEINYARVGNVAKAIEHSRRVGDCLRRAGVC